jgi:shikimate dehydrogenase
MSARPIDAATTLFAVFGDPVAHSLSPAMHNAAFMALGINSVYLAFGSPEIGPCTAAMRALGIRGASVTIPHKVAIMPLLDEIDAAARRIGAVNTVVNRGGRLLGANTDAEGALRALRNHTQIAGRTAVVVGAGGAARAVAFGLRDAGGRVTIVNRSIARGKDLARSVGADFRPLAQVTDLSCEILVNATPIGMARFGDALPIPAALLQPGMVVMDIVYTPLKTPLLAAAAARGCRTIPGTAMFVLQGARQFELWTGRPAPTEVMTAAVHTALAARGGPG